MLILSVACCFDKFFDKIQCSTYRCYIPADNVSAAELHDEVIQFFEENLAR